ncbi:TetR/AcrR family transcriptional regulator [Methylobacillus arboreus]|uniref:TetR/AcrR family transcriptional regulator n=1 Tax=Methylobacillus arboreus TaxID=755170 RepID=UPI001E44CC83|nr:TetR/AcrR family transcriptional regulator [Methylobacillus arboreus]MCB5191087.1 TetR/AcrR family transcriptional regulator [Methylobacillus arboreus]
MSSRMRDYILEAAGDLFSRQGFNSTSVDNIAAQAQVAKVTLYKYFKSKELLIIEYLREQNSKLWKKLAESPQQGNARDELESMVISLLEVIGDKDFKGFASINAGVEFPQADNPVNQISKEFSKQLREQMTELATRAGIKHAEALALQLALVIEGASIAERNQQGSQSILHAQALVKTLINSAT